MKKRNRFYVYAVIVDNKIRYIGKGTGGRAYMHIRIARGIVRRRMAGETVSATPFYEKLTEVWLKGSDIQISILKNKLTDRKAYAVECELIAKQKASQLWNTWSGGLGSPKGHKKSEQQKHRSSESNKKTWSDEKLKQKHSKRCKVIWLNPEYRRKTQAALKAAGQQPELRKKRSDAAKVRWANPEFREKMNRAFSDPAYKRLRSQATKQGWITRRQKIGGDNSL
jgi:hypothetical protein